jgi:hypothetical protein
VTFISFALSLTSIKDWSRTAAHARLSALVARRYDMTNLLQFATRLLAVLRSPGILALMCGMTVIPAHAVPSFARQTGQSCVACHAGGQFPELTPYGRMFKLTGYTLGERSNPLAVMLVGSLTKTRNNQDATGAAITPKDGKAIFDFASVFVAGKVTDNIGLFSQYTFANYDHQNASGQWVGHSGSDNTDLRFADHIITPDRDFIYGLSLNNSPGVQDAWNSSPAWGYPYLSSSLSPVASPPFTTMLEGGLAQQVGGIGGYLYWKRTLYAELSSYQSASGALSILRQGNYSGNLDHPRVFIRGQNPYWRLAYTGESGPHSWMLGAMGLNADVFPNDASAQPVFGSGSTRYRDIGVDAQYQYILDPHTISAQARYITERISDPSNLVLADDTSARLKTFRGKVSYTYRAKYGASLSVFNVSGNNDSAAFAGGVNNSPGTRGFTPELFWMPTQNLRLGVQYTAFTRYQGSKTNYDGAGRNAHDNNTAFLYAWVAY